jgi:hypothetical protein
MIQWSKFLGFSEILIQTDAFTAEAQRTLRRRDLGVDGVTTNAPVVPALCRRNARPTISGDRAPELQLRRRKRDRSFAAFPDFVSS